MKAAALLTGTRAWLQRTRCKWLLGMTIFCLLLRENYPFSNFPMYSSFSSRTYYLYLTDAKGTAIQTTRFGPASSTLKKIFDRYRRQELERFKSAGNERVPRTEASAGRLLLLYLGGLSANRPEAAGLLAGLQVQHVKVSEQGDALKLETHVVAQRP
ncbi:MAG: hypothetical protein ACR2II_02300 [Chthoniobacterales bacterium]